MPELPVLEFHADGLAKEVHFHTLLENKQTHEPQCQTQGREFVLQVIVKNVQQRDYGETELEIYIYILKNHLQKWPKLMRVEHLF